jgi:hypothetical protein
MRLTLGIAALAATFVAASPAMAQTAPVTSMAPAEARGLILTSESLSRVRDLDFGAVTVSTSMVSGNITIAAQETLNRDLDPGITALSGTAHSAKFVGYGAPNQTVTLSLDAPTMLQGPGTNVIPANLYLASGGTTQSVTVGASSTFEAFVGGVFTLNGGLDAGLYRADFELTAEYN